MEDLLLFATDDDPSTTDDTPATIRQASPLGSSLAHLDPKAIVAKLSLPPDTEASFESHLQNALAALQGSVDAQRDSVQAGVSRLEERCKSEMGDRVRGVIRSVRKAQQERRLRASGGGATSSATGLSDSSSAPILSGSGTAEQLSALLAKLAGEPTDAEKAAAREARLKAVRESALVRAAADLSAVTGGAELAQTLAQKRARLAAEAEAEKAEARAEAARVSSRLLGLPVPSRPGEAGGGLRGSASAASIFAAAEPGLTRPPLRSSSSAQALPPLSARSSAPPLPLPRSAAPTPGSAWPEQPPEQDSTAGGSSSASTPLLTGLPTLPASASSLSLSDDAAAPPHRDPPGSSRLLAALAASSSASALTAWGGGDEGSAEDEAAALQAGMSGLQDWLASALHDLSGAVIAPAQAAMAAAAGAARDSMLFLRGAYHADVRRMRAAAAAHLQDIIVGVRADVAAEQERAEARHAEELARERASKQAAIEAIRSAYTSMLTQCAAVKRANAELYDALVSIGSGMGVSVEPVAISGKITAHLVACMCVAHVLSASCAVRVK